MARMRICDFIENGYLQEANRLFFHPLGLSLVIEDTNVVGSIPVKNIDLPHDNQMRFNLEVTAVIDPTAGICSIWQDAENNYFEGWLDHERARYIEEKRQEIATMRMKSLGYVIQPIPDGDEDGRAGNISD